MNKRRTTLTVLALIASLGLSSAPALADKGGNGNGNGNGHGNSGNHGNHGNNGNNGNHGNKGNKDKGGYRNDDNLVSVSLARDRARSLAHNYGLTGYSSLPPGIAKIWRAVNRCRRVSPKSGALLDAARAAAVPGV